MEKQDEQKKSVVRQFVEEYKNRQNPDIVDKLVAEDCKVHIPLPGLPQGREGMRINGQRICAAFPDVHVDREFFVVDGDIVVERANAVATHKGELIGIQPTGRKVTWTELHAYRVQNGQITEVWSEADFMGIMVQLDVVKLPGS
jgi:predicted ester cyclase